MDIAKLKELLERVTTASGAEATDRAFLEWAQVAMAAQPSLLARLEAAENVVEAARAIHETGYGVADHFRLEAALTTYDQEKAREHG